MLYGEVEDFSAICTTQDKVYRLQQQVVDDVPHAGELIVGKRFDTNPVRHGWTKKIAASA